MRIVFIVLCLTLSGCGGAYLFSDPPVLETTERLNPPINCQEAMVFHRDYFIEQGVSPDRMSLLWVWPKGMAVTAKATSTALMNSDASHVALVIDGVAVFDNGGLPRCFRGGDYRMPDRGDFGPERWVQVAPQARCLLSEATWDMPESAYAVIPLQETPWRVSTD